MSWNRPGLGGSNQTNTSPHYDSYFVQKPIEIYVFIDPLCPECWSLEPYIKKLTIEYGRFFTIYPIIGGYLNPLNKEPFDQPKKLREIWERTAKRTGMSCDGDLWIENPINSPKAAFLAIKAAELQGKRAGRVFLRKVQEKIFLDKQDISKNEILLECAKEAELDIEEFQEDLYSPSAKKALQCDLKLTKEMEVDYTPTIVFFNRDIEEQGIKISGLYPYDIYVRVLIEMLQKTPIPSEKPPLEQFLAYYDVVGSKEVSEVYGWTIGKAEREMKKLQLKQKVKKIQAKHGNFWKYLK
ncbi:ClpXP adapter SpxH family protein [Ornithinibacillus halophilus]|uniref:ClpXP adapter protein SpxH n=1 Tax=Ornithinibacillus halophilus TaxID=930117 RepID=A0A1M5IRA3_9BACI|nr:ClpXP adapter SpxH family protein [Ornithinibacillus halophilus]SHG30854.1 Predicted dithiol-disulfide isomerase, DsbA family [Ornithinibacillus halophilus]